MSDHSPHTNELSQPAGGCPLDCAAGRPVPERCAVLLATLLQYAKYPATPNSTRWVSFILPDDFLTEAEDALADALAPGPSDRMPPAGIELSGSVMPAAWIDRSWHPHHLSYMQGARERQLYGTLQPLYAMPDDLAEYVLGHLISERASLDGFLALGNERTRAERLDRWIEALTPNVAR